MNTKPAVRLVKKEEREGKPPAPVELAPDPNRWSKAVQSWVSEFQQDRLGKSRPAFDRLFK